MPKQTHDYHISANPPELIERVKAYSAYYGLNGRWEGNVFHGTMNAIDRLAAFVAGYFTCKSDMNPELRK